GGHAPESPGGCDESTEARFVPVCHVIQRKFSRSLFPTGHMSRALGQPETKKLATKTVWFETLRRSNIRDGHGQQGLDRGYTEA
ncbi:hypothetical protein CH063_10140, partial [Colletotrichum higginsianum]